KAESRGLLHKSDLGCVSLNCASDGAVTEAYRDVVEKARRAGFAHAVALVQPMVAGVAEAYAGVIDDPTYGPAICFGLGGAFDEADGDRGVKVIILTGNGRAFCAGRDQDASPATGVRNSDPKGKSHAEFIEYWQRSDSRKIPAWQHMWRLGKPIIAAVNGWA